MAGSGFLLDTNVLLYYLGGRLPIDALPEGLFYISFITELEVLGYGRLDPAEELRLARAIASIPVLEIDASVKAETIALRRNHRLRLPDAIIAATCKAHGLALVTSDSDFTRLSQEVELVLIPPERIERP